MLAYFYYKLFLKRVLFLGNVSFDPVSMQLVFTSDSSNGEASNSNTRLIPYIPYPINPETGQPVFNKFHPLQKKSDLVYLGPMIDEKTGQTVPILGITIHPVTGKIFVNIFYFLSDCFIILLIINSGQNQKEIFKIILKRCQFFLH